MSKIFLIAGLGADTRLYNNIDLGDNDVTPVDWIEPNETDTLNTYSQKLIHQYFVTNNSIVIGVSLGGMIATEIAKQLRLNKVILISSIKTISEAPWYFKFFNAVPLYKILTGRVLGKIGYIAKPFFGHMDKHDAWLFHDMVQKSSPKFLKWAIGAALTWDNQVVPPNMYHIHGDKDLVFNYKNIINATIVKGGTHIMVFDKAKQINKILKDILKKK
ncbi:alpha/beta hydrolase [Mucilaginibacter sp. dw_454]|uniref:alpha/beta hydrolase n=1 Tax=Mucilaginibacter sp. dw_454 TaxID=2720079 RepID=UPI001BD4B7A2|nr:alpha/beta hydrolase [Mucilaginibacter sp. dw_454]